MLRRELGGAALREVAGAGVDDLLVAQVLPFAVRSGSATGPGGPAI